MMQYRSELPPLRRAPKGIAGRNDCTADACLTQLRVEDATDETGRTNRGGGVGAGIGSGYGLPAQNVSEQYLLAAANQDRAAHGIGAACIWMRTLGRRLGSTRWRWCGMGTSRTSLPGEVDLADAGGAMRVRTFPW